MIQYDDYDLACEIIIGDDDCDDGYHFSVVVVVVVVVVAVCLEWLISG